MTLGIFITIISIVVGGVAILLSALGFIVPTIETRFGFTGWWTSILGIGAVALTLTGFHIHLLLTYAASI